MNPSDSPSDSDACAPRRNLLRHHEVKRGREAVPETVPPDPLALEPPSPGLPPPLPPPLPPAKAEAPSSTSLKSALARANLLEDSIDAPAFADSDPFRTAELDPNARSSLPLALARANESRKFPSKPIEPDAPESSGVEAGASLTDFFFRFDGFSDQLHPLGRWRVFSLVYAVTVFALGHGFALRSLPVHPGVRQIIDTAGFWAGYLGRSFGIGLGLTLLLSVICLILFRAAKGAPPFLWVFKVVVYALVPLTLMRVYQLLELTDIGMEAYLRGFRPENWTVSGQIIFTVTGIWSTVRVFQSASSRHCQANPAKMAFPAGVLLLLGLGVLWGQTTIVQGVGRGALASDLARVEALFQNADSRAEAEAEALGDRKALVWSHGLKVRYYRLRGEIRYLSGNVGGAREDMIRLVRMHPGGHPMALYGRAVNFLAIGQDQEGLRLMEAVNRDADGELSDAVRWLYRIHRGDFGEGVRDAAEAERWARYLQHADPNALHLEMAVEAMFVTGQNRRVLRELAEAERMDIRVSAPAAVSGALAALELEQEDLAETWWTRALTLDPDLAADARTEALRARFTSRP